MKMTNLERELCEVVYNFVKEHIEEVVKNLTSRGHTWDYLGAENSEDLLDQIKSTPDVAAWALTELCAWGMDKNYCKELFTEEDGVYKINDYLFEVDAYEGIITEVNKNYLWVARCKNQALLIFDIKPVLREGIWQRPNKPYGNWWELPAELYPEVTFENSPKKLRV